MIMLRTLLATIALVLLSGPLNAHANIIYNWIGDCDGIITPAPHGGTSNGCTGQAAMLVVTTDAYIPGEVSFAPFPPGSPPVLLHALYADENITFDFAPFFPPTAFSSCLPPRPRVGLFTSRRSNSIRMPTASGE
jgi:hypothetical protein